MKVKIYCHFCQHPLISKFVDERERLYCQNCNTPIYENPIPATAAVILNENNEILFVKRKVEPKKGLWCLPGGYVELDEKPETCCLRELREETNLEGEIKKLVGVYLSENPIYRSVLVIGFEIKNAKGEIRAGYDSEEVEYFNTKNLPDIAFESHRALIRDVLTERKGHSILSPVLKAISDFGAYVISSQNHYDIIERSCQAGARIVQYRDKTSNRKVMLDTAHKIRQITAQYNTRFIVNDYIDLALISKADGVHLGQDDVSIQEARKVAGDDLIIGISTHSLEQALKAQKNGADYIAIGPVFSTPTKKEYQPIGLDIVRQVVAAISVPLVAIGGLNLDNMADLKKIGIKNIAMVRGFQNNTKQMVKQVNALFLP
jgi:thiamine-phosphate diphosphorylase